MDVDFEPWFILDDTSPSGLRWKVDRYAGKDYKVRKVAAGDVAGCRASNGYYLVRLNKRLYRAHRVICEMLYGGIDRTVKVDHEDGNPSNNAHSNLRVTTQAINARNSKMKSTNSSGVTGVYHQKMKSGYEYMVAQAEVAGKVVTRQFSVIKLGLVLATESAVKARQEMLDKFNAEGAGFSERHGK